MCVSSCNSFFASSSFHALCLFSQVTSETDVRNAVKVAVDTYGGITAAVNCAGIGIAKKTMTKKGPHPLNEFEQVLRVNTVGSFNVIRLVATAMAEGEPYSASGERGNQIENHTHQSPGCMYVHIHSEVFLKCYLSRRVSVSFCDTCFPKFPISDLYIQWNLPKRPPL